ncbi:hypothetical protein GCM10009097_30670 [Pigmentiphaga daeguensis]|uniref:Uncharacterized protein n=1 Tax=Pigmentiphaga daeguensis TaxID=414049 RepID=A0ABN1C4K2_9BURK
MEILATFIPCAPSGIAQPMMASWIRPGSSPGTCANAARSTWINKSSGRTVRNAPRGAFPIGVRDAATTYAS